MNIGAYIKALRDSKGMTQQQLSDIIDVSDKTISSWELNNKMPRMGALQKLADYFKIPLSSFYETNDHINLKAELLNIIDKMDENQLRKFIQLSEYAYLSDDDFERLCEIARLAIQ